MSSSSLTVLSDPDPEFDSDEDVDPEELSVPEEVLLSSICFFPLSVLNLLSGSRLSLSLSVSIISDGPFNTSLFITCFLGFCS